MRTWGAPIGAWAFFLLLPFLVLWRFVPFLSETTIGNDYTQFPVEGQLEVIWSWRHGLIPLYLPGFAEGASASAMTLGQAWHPITWLCALTPTYGSGSAEQIVTLYRLLELGITHRVVYRETRAVGIGRLPAFGLSFAVIFNGRMLDSFRYGASLESFCGMFLACAVFSSARRQGWTFRRIAWGAFTVYLTLVGGHPQWALFGIMAACLFAAGLLVRPSPDAKEASRPRFFGGVAISGIVGGLLSAGYALPFATEFMAQNAGRVDQTYAFTLGFGDTVRGTLANLTRPLESDVHGAFGGTAWMLVLLLSVPIALIGLRRPLPILLPTIAAVVAGVFALGKATPLHEWVVHHVPLFSSFRVPGRATLWIPPMMLLVGWVSLSDLSRPELRRRFLRGPVIAWAGFLAVAVLLAFDRLSPNISASAFSPLYFSDSPQWVDAQIAACFGVTAAMLAFVWTARPRARATVWTLCLLATVASAAVTLPFGTWKTKRKATPTSAAMDAHHAKHLVFWGYAGMALENKTVARANAAKLPLARKSGEVVEHWTVAPDDEQAVKLAAANRGQTFLTGPGVVARAAAEAEATATAELTAVQWNRWRYAVDAPQGGAFVFGQPTLPQWRATVDGKPTPLVTANGSFPTLMLEPGKHEVELRFFSPSSMIGAALFFGTLLAGAAARHLLLAKGSFRQRAATTAMALAILLVAGLWYRGLYPDVDVRTFGDPAEMAKL